MSKKLSEPRIELHFPLVGQGVVELSIPATMTRQNFDKFMAWIRLIEDTIVDEPTPNVDAEDAQIETNREQYGEADTYGDGKPKTWR